MHFVPVIAAACVLLETASAAGVYVPIHKRYSYDALVNDFSYLGMLSKRDACSDAFGSNAHNSICAPDFTLCCTRDRQSYPSCEKWIGKGWCCVGEGDNDMCYVDQASVCNQEGSVECTRLKTGAKKACCPKLTTCDSNTDAYEQAVRCNIARGDLIEAAKSAEAKTASTSSTSTASSSSIDAPTSTSASAAQTTAPESQAATPTGSGDDDSSTISGGAIGGIVVGAVAGVGLIAGLVWFFMRRNKKAKYEAASQNPQPSIPQYYEDQQLKYQQQQQGYWPQGSPNQGGYSYSSPQPPSELMNHHPPVELDSGYHQYQQPQQEQMQPQHSPQPQHQQQQQ